jgi:hypothetical protein
MERAYRNPGYFLLALLLSEIPAFDPSITLSVHIHAMLLFT